MKMFLVTVALLALIGPVQAPFKATPHTSTFENGNFEYGVLQLASQENESDPVMSVSVVLNFKDDDKKQLDTLYVTHGTVFGSNYSRSEQYTNVRLVQTPGKLEAVWHGVWKKNQRSP